MRKGDTATREVDSTLKKEGGEENHGGKPGGFGMDLAGPCVFSSHSNRSDSIVMS